MLTEAFSLADSKHVERYEKFHVQQKIKKKFDSQRQQFFEF